MSVHEEWRGTRSRSSRASTIYLALGVIGILNLSFGVPAGRTAYSPANAIETYLMDMYLNAQNEVYVEAGETERNVIASAGLSIFFEMLAPNGNSKTSAELFTEHNLQLIRRAQLLVEEDAGRYARARLRTAPSPRPPRSSPRSPTPTLPIWTPPRRLHRRRRSRSATWSRRRAVSPRVPPR
ncbi:hypothetical protein T492DRAFT_986671 [Pavlovales sp. CCMP2436]|nr:hypothetical protein T492DRAFT_986671 [Pavlovales sp. CCMP2436]